MQNKTIEIIVKGKLTDNNTRSVHYHSPLDVIAVKFKCCDQYYPCYYCHLEEAGHPAAVWKKNEFDANAILCGMCLQEMTVAAYKACNYQCPFCNAAFNPKWANHNHLYFEV